MTRAQRKIMAVWNMADEEFPDKSTEFIIAIVLDKCKCEYSDVIEALAKENEASP